MFERGRGPESVSGELGVSYHVVRKWHKSYHAVGREALASMGSVHRTYSQDTKVAATREHVEGGVPAAEVMAEHGIASETALQRWCRSYREGGPDALAPRPKGRPATEPRPASREEELERENRRLRAEVAYLKKVRALGSGGSGGGTPRA